MKKYLSLQIMNPISGALGSRGDPVDPFSGVDQDGRVPLHEEQGEAGDCVAANLTLILTSLSCQSLGNLLHLPHCNPVPAPKRFKCKGDERDTLSLTVISCSSHNE